MAEPSTHARRGIPQDDVGIDKRSMQQMGLYPSETGKFMHVGSSMHSGYGHPGYGQPQHHPYPISRDDTFRCPTVRTQHVSALSRPWQFVEMAVAVLVKGLACRSLVGAWGRDGGQSEEGQQMRQSAFVSCAQCPRRAASRSERAKRVRWEAASDPHTGACSSESQRRMDERYDFLDPAVSSALREVPSAIPSARTTFCSFVAWWRSVFGPAARAWRKLRARKQG
jgi:hypothetical protein